MPFPKLLALALCAACPRFVPADGSEFEPQVLAEITHNLRFHRAEPKYVNPNGPCSTTVDIGKDTTTDGILKLVGQRLGFPASRLEWGGAVISSARLHRLPDETVLDVFEAPPDEHELRRLNDHPQYDLETARSLQAVNVATLCPASSLRNWSCSRCAASGFSFLPAEIHVLEAGANNDLLAVVAPDHSRGWLVVALRGTVDKILLDWIIDLEFDQRPFELPGFAGALVHAGFLGAWNGTSTS